MNFLRGLGVAATGIARKTASDHAAAQDAEEKVEALLDRVVNCVSSGEQSKALQELSALMATDPGARVSLGGIGFQHLLNIVRTERDDVRCLCLALEVMLAAVSAFSDPFDESAGEDSGVLAAVAERNASLLTEDARSVELVLALLEDPPVGSKDGNVRYLGLKLLRACMDHGAADKVREQVLDTPTHLDRLLLLLDARNALAFESMRLLKSLAQGSPACQGAMAAGGALERLVSAVDTSGGLAGGPEVASQLRLVRQILAGNLQACERFVTGGLLARLLDLLAPALSGHLEGEGTALSPDAVANTVSALDCLEALGASSGSAIDPATVRALCQHALGSPAAHIVMDPAVRVAAMRALASVLRSSPAARDVFLSGDVPWAPTPGKSADGDSTDATLALSAAQAALRHALRSATDAVRDGAAEVLRAFFQGSPDGQLALASTLAPLSGDDGEATFGTELLSALCGKSMGHAAGPADPQEFAMAATVLASVMHGNEGVRRKALKLTATVEDDPADPRARVLHRVVRSLRSCLHQGSPRARASARALRLLVVWCQGCPEAAQAICGDPEHFAVAVDILSNRIGPPRSRVVPGLAALLVGTCVAASRDTDGGAQRVLVDSLVERVGLSVFFAALDALVEAADKPETLHADHVAGAHAAAGGLVGAARSLLEAMAGFTGGHHADGDGMDAATVALVKEAVEGAREAVAHSIAPVALGGGSAAGLAPAPSAVEQLRAVLRDLASDTGGPEAPTGQAEALLGALEQEVQELRARNAALAQDALSRRGRGADAAPTTPGDAEELAALRRRAAEAEARLGEVEEEAGRLRAREAEASGRVAELETALAEAQARATEAEGEAEAVREAYAAMEAGAFQNEARVHELEEKLKVLGEGGSAVDVVSLEQRIRAELKEELDSVNDLLVCLGLEEGKVEALSQRLQEMGVDPATVLADAGHHEGRGADGGDGGARSADVTQARRGDEARDSGVAPVPQVSKGESAAAASRSGPEWRAGGDRVAEGGDEDDEWA